MIQSSTPTPKTSSPFYMKVETAELWWIKRARENPADFITYLTDGEKRPARHHLRWIKAMFDPDYKNCILEAWPGSAKTTIMLYVMAWEIGSMPWHTHGIFSASEEQAKQRLSELREIILLDRFRNVFPWVEIDLKRPNNATTLNIWSRKWKDGRDVSYSEYRKLINKHGEPRDHTVFAAGITSKSITGKRISGRKLIDDPHNEQNSATPEQRIKVTNAIKKEIMSRKSTKSTYNRNTVIMTPWAEDDCAGRLRQDKRSDGSPVWLFLKTPIRNEDGSPAWPELFPEHTIQDIEAEQGAIIFDLMYMLNELAAGSRQVTLDMLRKPLPATLPEFKDLVISTDFARTQGLNSDYTVFGAYARDMEKHWNLYVLDLIRFQEDQVNERVARLAEFADQIFAGYGRINRILFDNTDTQSEMQMLADLRPDLPIEPIKIKGANKENRARAPYGWIQQGRVYWNMSAQAYHAACSELIGFPMVPHDDTVDNISLPYQQPTWHAGFSRAGTKRVRSRVIL